MTAFDLGTKSNNMMNAWRLLNATVIKFKNDECDKRSVINAYIEDERQIGNVTFQQGGSPSSGTATTVSTTTTNEHPSTT